jgi:outer membrane protein
MKLTINLKKMKEHYIRKIPLLIFGICLSLSNYINAQTPRFLTLEEAITLGVTHSKNLQLDNYNSQIADSKILQNKNAKLPQVGVNLSYIRISDNITPFKVAFPQGEVVLNPQILNQSYNSLQVKQLLWAGGRLKYADELLAMDKKAIGFDSQKNKLDAAFEVTSLWYNLFTIKQSKKIILANIDLLNNQKRDADNFVKQGIILGNDLLKIELAVTNLESSLSDISTTESLLKFNLITLTGLDPKSDIDIPDTLPNLEQEGDNLNTYLEKALQNRAELRSLAIRKEQANLAQKIAQSNFLPTLAASGSVNYDMPNQRVFPNVASLTATWNVGVALSWNLTDLYTNKEKVKDSNLSYFKMNTVIEQAREGIQLEVNANYNNYLQAKQKIQLANKSVEQATENFRVEQNKFQTNTTTSTDFLNANTLLLQSKINLTTTIANAGLAYRKLLKSIN